jgi:magnesium transporter
MVRSLSLGYVQSKSVLRIMLRQATTALMLAVLTAVAAGLAGHFLVGHWQMAFVVGLSMLCAVTWASTMGAVVPILFDRMGIDPAVASGPRVSPANDIVAILIYLGLAARLLQVWV